MSSTGPTSKGCAWTRRCIPLTMLASGLYGQELPPQDGAPIRLVVPWKYGFKGIKSIVKIDAGGGSAADDVEPARAERVWVLRQRESATSIIRAGARPPSSASASSGRRPTLMFNGYADQVASLYTGMDLARTSSFYPLSPCNRGERARVRGSRSTFERSPLTLTLSPEYRGEGKKNHERPRIRQACPLRQRPCAADPALLGCLLGSSWHKPQRAGHSNHRHDRSDFFYAYLIVTPVRKITGWNFVSNFRRMLGLFAFFYGCVHLFIYVGLYQSFSLSAVLADLLRRPFIFYGMAALLLMAPLAATSTNGIIKKMGAARWKRLHKFVYPAGDSRGASLLLIGQSRYAAA